MVNAYEIGEKYDELLARLAQSEDRPKVTILRRAIKQYSGDENDTIKRS